MNEAGSIFSGEGSALFAPSKKDIIVVLAYHTPMIMMLGKGKISVKIGREKRHITTVEGGLLYVCDNEATILVNL